jgi:polysaccharide export outer membrane protein
MRNLIAFWTVGAALACSSAPPGPIRPPELHAEAPEDAKLAAGDVIEIRVYREPDLAGVYRVSNHGEIDFPLIRKVRLLGLNADEVAEQIRSRLADGFIRDPQVSVFVRERNSQKVHVLGFVTKPGSFSFEPGMTVVEAIARAGGFAQHAATNSVKVTRSVGEQEQNYELAAEDISRGRVPNFSLMPGDIVYVPEAIF